MPTVHPTTRSTSLLVILVLVVTDNIVESKLIDTLGRADDPQPVPELLLLQELLGQVLEVAARELLVRDHLDAAILLVRDGDVVA